MLTYRRRLDEWCQERPDQLNRPQTFKTYPAAPVQLLPRALVASELSAVEVLSGVKGRRTLDLALLGTLLFLADGVVRV